MEYLWTWNITKQTSLRVIVLLVWQKETKTRKIPKCYKFDSVTVRLLRGCDFHFWGFYFFTRVYRLSPVEASVPLKRRGAVWGKLNTMNRYRVLLTRTSPAICAASTSKTTWEHKGRSCIASPLSIHHHYLRFHTVKEMYFLWSSFYSLSQLTASQPNGLILGSWPPPPLNRSTLGLLFGRLVKNLGGGFYSGVGATIRSIASAG